MTNTWARSKINLAFRFRLNAKIILWNKENLFSSGFDPEVTFLRDKYQENIFVVLKMLPVFLRLVNVL